MELMLLVILSLVICVFIFWKVGDYFSPWFLTTAIWFGILLMFQFQNDILYPLSNQFYICLSIWVPCFCLSSLLTVYSLPKVAHPEKECIAERPYSETVFNALFVLSMIITPLYLYKILKVVMMFDTTDMLYNLRIWAVHGENDLGILNYAHYINRALFVVAICLFPKVSKWKLAAIIIANLMFQFAIMEKSGLLFMFAATLFILYEKRIIKAKTILATILIIIVLFFLINFFKEIKSDETAESMTFVDFFAIYLLSPSVAFGKVQQDLSPLLGSNTFQIIHHILYKWGINSVDIDPMSRIQEFVWVPLPTNVYTIFQPFYQDFGYMGIAFFGIVYGVISGLTYNSFLNGSFFGRCIYAYIVKVLLTQFFSEDLFQDLITFIYYAFFVYLITQNDFKFKYEGALWQKAK